MSAKGSRGEESGGTRARMLDVAEDHFARKGFSGAHLESIASEVGVRKTALYYYFDSKSALYTAVLDRIAVGLDRVVKGVFERGELGHVERLELLSAELNALFASNLNYSQIMMRIFVDRTPVADTAVLDTSLGGVMSDISKFYQEGRDAGVFRKQSARQFLLSFLGMLLFYYAGRESSAQMLGVENVVDEAVVAWRGESVRQMLLRGVLD